MDVVQKALTDAGLHKGDIQEIVLVGGSTRIPKIQKLLHNFFDEKELNKSIAPDEAVARGAAIQAAILRGQFSQVPKDFVLIDVVPLSLGVQVKGGFMSTIIKRNSSTPVLVTKVYSTCDSAQTSIDIDVYQGERP